VNRFKIDLKKLSRYCLNPKHPVGKHKAKVFYASLGIGQKEARLLKREMLKQIKTAVLQKEFEDEYGVRYSAVISIVIDKKEAAVKTVWIVRTGQEVAELVTCFIQN